MTDRTIDIGYVHVVAVDAACRAAWPGCYEGGYNPACCRFPKSCSCNVFDYATNKFVCAVNCPHPDHATPSDAGMLAACAVLWPSGGCR